VLVSERTSLGGVAVRSTLEAARADDRRRVPMHAQLARRRSLRGRRSHPRGIADHAFGVVTGAHVTVPLSPTAPSLAHLRRAAAQNEIYGTGAGFGARAIESHKEGIARV
jgi:hypothetical protein